MLRQQLIFLIIISVLAACGESRDPTESAAQSKQATGHQGLHQPSSPQEAKGTPAVKPDRLQLPKLPELSANMLYIKEHLEEDLAEAKADFQKGEDIHFSCVGMLANAQDRDFLKVEQPETAGLRDEVIRLCTLDWRLAGLRRAAAIIEGIRSVRPGEKFMMDCVDLDKHLKVVEENGHGDLPEVASIKTLYNTACR